MIRIEVRGLEKLQAAMAAYPAFVRAIPRGQLAFKPRHAARVGGRLIGGTDNRVIAQAQAAQGRNVWFVNAADKQNAVRIFREAAIAFCRQSKERGQVVGAERAARRAAQEAYDALVERVRQRILRSTTFKRPLTERYAEWKRRAVGQQPILVLTGQLAESMYAKLEGGGAR